MANNNPHDMEGEEEAVWGKKFQDILDGITNKGDFAYHSKIEVPSLQPRISVKGVAEHLAFPLLKGQAENLKTVAVKAPYGKGSEKIND